jgi:hypothetical protein
MANICLTHYTNGFFASVPKSPTQMGSLSVYNSVTNISRLGTFNVHTHIQVAFLNNFKIVGPLSKMKPCTRRVPKISKKTLANCNVHIFDNQLKAVVDAHIREYRNKWQTTAWESQLG